MILSKIQITIHTISKYTDDLLNDETRQAEMRAAAAALDAIQAEYKRAVAQMHTDFPTLYAACIEIEEEE